VINSWFVACPPSALHGSGYDRTAELYGQSSDILKGIFEDFPGGRFVDERFVFPLKWGDAVRATAFDHGTLKTVKSTRVDDRWYLGLILLAVSAQLSAPGSIANAEPVISISSLSASFFPNSTDTGAFTATPSSAVAFAQDFSAMNFNPPVGTVPCSNDTGVNVYTRPFTNIVPQANGSCRTVPVQGNGLQAGTGQLSSFNAVFTGSFTLASGGNVTFNFFSDDGWILSIGSGRTGSQPSYVSGPFLNSPNSGPFTRYQVVGAFNLASSPAQNNLIVNFPSDGAFPFELDYSECCGQQLSLTLTANGEAIPATPLSPAAATATSESASTATIPATTEATPQDGATAVPTPENGNQLDQRDGQTNIEWPLLIIAAAVVVVWGVGVLDNRKSRF
jgi:hypothetical protein